MVRKNGRQAKPHFAVFEIPVATGDDSVSGTEKYAAGIGDHRLLKTKEFDKDCGYEGRIKPERLIEEPVSKRTPI